MKPHTIIAALALASVATAEPTVIKLKDGTTVTGEVSRVASYGVTLMMPDGIRRISLDDMDPKSRSAFEAQANAGKPDEIAQLREENARLRAEIESLKGRLANAPAPATPPPTTRYVQESDHQRRQRADMIERVLLPEAKADVTDLEDQLIRDRAQHDTAKMAKRRLEISRAKERVTALNDELSKLRASQ